jgi:hypothetical protein
LADSANAFLTSARERSRAAVVSESSIFVIDEHLVVRPLLQIYSRLSLLAFALSVPLAAAIAQGGSALTPDGADARETPTPVYADGSPGQYVLTGNQWPQPGGKGTPITLTYSFQNMFDGALKMPNGQPLPASLIRGSIEEALRLWSSVAPLNFVEVPDDGLFYGNGSTQFGQIRYRHVYLNGQDPAVGDPIAKAQTYYPPGDGYPGDVEFDDTDFWQEVGTLHQPDVLGAAIHETGHALGLAHSTGITPGQYWSYLVSDGNGGTTTHLEPMGNANMFWIFTRYSGLGTGQLGGDDILGIQAIYGAGHGSVTSLVPEPATWLLFVITIAGAVVVFSRRRGPKAVFAMRPTRLS